MRRWSRSALLLALRVVQLLARGAAVQDGGEHGPGPLALGHQALEQVGRGEGARRIASATVTFHGQ
ncbi:hypothetical protein AB0G20_37990 [Streptomyces sp. NPDC024017]|uniref:hypothetical protein n=1 Tax=Streptomyces sp. NPDC024017 TaxID=3154326 RepID=UPI0033F31DF8